MSLNWPSLSGIPPLNLWNFSALARRTSLRPSLNELTNDTENSAKTVDTVNHPDHYTAGGIECIDAIQAALTKEEFRGYIKGNAIKYIWRERLKGGSESMAKAMWYQKRLADTQVSSAGGKLATPGEFESLE